MNLFADHVAEIHVNTLMRECIPSFEALVAVVPFENCSSVCNCDQKLSCTLGYIKDRCLSLSPLCCCLVSWKAQDF